MVQLAGNPVVGRLAGRGLETEWLGALKETADLLQRLEPLDLEHDDHPPMIPNSDRLQAHFTLESRHSFRLMCRWKRLVLVMPQARKVPLPL